MRSLQKGPKPQVLVTNGDTWRDELVATLAANQTPTAAMKERYRHPEIKTAVTAETDGKCAYCESKVRHIAHGDIEHIIPKSKVPEKAYAWDNLTLACAVCNGNKGDYYSDDPANSQDSLIDPYVDNPSDHFLYMREIVTPRPDSMRGLATEDVLKLTRTELLERRRERMDFIDGLVRAYHQADQAYKPLLLRDLTQRHLRDDNEYAGVTQAYAEHLRSKGLLP